MIVAATDFHLVLHAEEVFTIGGLSITNSMLLGWLASAFLVVIFIMAAKRISVKPKKSPVALIELGVESITNLAAQVMGSRARAIKYAPFLVTLFCFILLNNWFGLLPGVGTIEHNGEPLFRAWTADLTGTLAIAITSIVLVQIYAFRKLRPKKYLQHYFTNKPYNPINLFVGLLEVLGEFTRMASLSLRLFGNIFAGEVLLLVLSVITSYATPVATLPFIILEFFVGFIQAFVFTMLVIVYLSLGTSDHEEEHEQSSDHSADVNTALAEGSPTKG
jgi:F-type H+-transporting ATPase subunit a